MTGTDNTDVQRVIPVGAGTYQGERVQGPQIVEPDGSLTPVYTDGRPRVPGTPRPSVIESGAIHEHLKPKRFTPEQEIVADVLGIALDELYNDDGTSVDPDEEAATLASVNRMVTLIKTEGPKTPEEQKLLGLYDHVNGLLSLDMTRFPDEFVQNALLDELPVATQQLNAALDNLVFSETNVAGTMNTTIASVAPESIAA